MIGDASVYFPSPSLQWYSCQSIVSNSRALHCLFGSLKTCTESSRCTEGRNESNTHYTHLKGQRHFSVITPVITAVLIHSIVTTRAVWYIKYSCYLFCWPHCGVEFISVNRFWMSVLLNIVNLWLVAQSALVGHLFFLFIFMYFLKGWLKVLH